MNRETIFSDDRNHRYTLWREWPPSIDLFDGTNDGERGRDTYVNFIGLNPSTADEKLDDPTIRRCVGFAKAWGYSAFCMTNLFAFRATQPPVMMTAADPVGPDNDKWLCKIARNAGMIVAAWGAFGEFMERGTKVRAMFVLEHIGPLRCLGTTQDGHPKHPLYLPKNASIRDLN